MGGIGLEVLHAAATTLQNLAFAWSIGSVLASLWIVRATAPERRDLDRGLARSMPLAACVLIATQIVLLWLEAAVMADVSLVDAMPFVPDVLRGTHFGAVWVFGLTAVVAVLVLAMLRARKGTNKIQFAAIAIVLVAFAYTRSLISHAADHGDLGFAVALDWIHLLFIGAWVGEVLVATLIVLPRLHAAAESGASATRFAQALSHSATVVVIGVLVTGVVKAWQSIVSLDNLVGNVYGDTLTIKLVLVAAAIGLGGFNRFFVLPAVVATDAHSSQQQRRSGLIRFMTVLRFETVVLIGVTIAAAVLSASAPPMGAQ